MSLQPPLLANHFASLRAATAAAPQGGWLPSSLHALISALFARLFDRLEQFLLLWQSGQLPTRRESAPRPAADHTPAPAHPPTTASRTKRRARARTHAPKINYTPATRTPSPNVAPRAGAIPPSIPSRPRTRPARAPPSVKNPTSSHRKRTPYLLRNQNK